MQGKSPKRSQCLKLISPVSFYADKISYRDLAEADIIFTRIDKLVFLDQKYEIISEHGNYLLLRIK